MTTCVVGGTAMDVAGMSTMTLQKALSSRATRDRMLVGARKSTRTQKSSVLRHSV